MVECLPSRSKVLNSAPSTEKGKTGPPEIVVHFHSSFPVAKYTGDVTESQRFLAVTHISYRFSMPNYLPGFWRLGVVLNTLNPRNWETKAGRPLSSWPGRAT